MGKNREELQKQKQEQEAEREAKEAKKAKANPVVGTVPDPDNPDAPPVPVPTPEPVVEEQIIELRTKDTTFAFTTYGGGVKYAEFIDQFAVGDSENLVRLNRFGEEPVGRLTTDPDEYLDVIYKYQEEKSSATSVTFFGQINDKLFVRKIWSLVDDTEAGNSYLLNLKIVFINGGNDKIDLKDYGIFAGSATPLWKGEPDRHTTLFYRKDDDYKKYPVAKFKKGKKPIYEKDAGSLGFAGVNNQFFATIVEPDTPYLAEIWGFRDSVRLPEPAGGLAAEAIRMGMSLPDETLAANSEFPISFEVFMGPKSNLVLRKTGEGRGDVMNYGWLGPISWFLNWLLNVLHSWIFGPMAPAWGWGWAIVALTVIIRGVMWPLQNKSTRAMKRMSKLQPEMKDLKEKYADDPQRMNQEMMKMYREYGINPLGGCLPLIVQIPIFFGFYTMLMYAVELRQQSFLWVEDLSQPDTIYHLPFSLPFLGNGVNLLPIVMAVTMVLQMSLTPKTGDKMQRRLFMMMPIIFFFFCYNFASALALYWTTSNIFAIGQMLITKRLPEPELKKKKAGGAGFFQKMAARAEEAKKAQKAQRAKQMGGPDPKKPKKNRPRTGG